MKGLFLNSCLRVIVQVRAIHTVFVAIVFNHLQYLVQSEHLLSIFNKVERGLKLYSYFRLNKSDIMKMS